MAKKSSIKTCRGCGRKIDISTEEYIELSPGWYYEIKCANDKIEKNKKEEEDKVKREQIHEICEQLFGNAYKKTRVSMQINNYLKNGHTLDEIINGINYWFFIKKQDVNKANGGIGILDYIWDEVYDYYDEQKNIKKITETGGFEYFKNPKNINYFIKRIPIKAPLRLIDLDFTID